MNILISKLQSVERYFSDAKGDFELFALFLRTESVDKWDLLVSAPWIEKDKQNSLRKISNKVQRTLNQDELVQISRVVLIDSSNRALEAIHRAVNIEHGSAEVQESNFFGVLIKHAFIITSKKIGTQAGQPNSTLALVRL